MFELVLQKRDCGACLITELLQETSDCGFPQDTPAGGGRKSQAHMAGTFSTTSDRAECLHPNDSLDWFRQEAHSYLWAA